MNFFSHPNSTHLDVPNNLQIAKSHARLPTFLTSSVSIDGDGCLPSWKCLFCHWVLLYHFSLFSGSPFPASLDLIFFFPQPPNDWFFFPQMCVSFISLSLALVSLTHSVSTASQCWGIVSEVAVIYFLFLINIHRQFSSNFKYNVSQQVSYTSRHSYS